MSIETRALYYSLRMLWLEDPSMEVQAWQVENYREMSLPLLFSRLRQHSLNFDSESFMAWAEECDTPEELCELFVEDRDLSQEELESIYLLVFELWRRLEKERPSLSIFCDELDHQIHFYQQGREGHEEELQDALANLEVVLDENVDEGGEPEEVFAMVNSGCCYDLEAFLYEFISDQIDNPYYASELLDNFEEYVSNVQWFELLRAQLHMDVDPEGAAELFEELAQEALEDDDLNFNLELLSKMVHEGGHQLFVALVTRSIALIEDESDFQELLAICVDYYSCLDFDSEEEKLQSILNNRPLVEEGNPFDPDDSDVSLLLKILA